MKKSVKFLAVCLAAAAMLSMSACNGGGASSGAASDSSNAGASTSTLDTIKKNGFITMSTNAEFEPFEYKDGDDVVGIDIEISKKIAEKLGVQLKVNDVAFDSLIPEITSGKADFVAAGMTADDERRKNVDFSDSYFDAGQAIIVKKGGEIKQPQDLDGKKVGVQTGTTGDKYCTNEDGTSKIKVGSVERYNKGMDAVSDLIAGRIDAVVIDNFPAEKFVEKNSDKIAKLDDMLTNEQYAIAVKKGNTELTELINQTLKELKDSGDLQKICDKYLAQE
ncbi:transporter substrate-binding domain-containing protein [Faecalispora anaeroviscerum]|uniref:transporter substrate-binding domain-containing protein n=1 Tax=Faecalispora anaeroviscerum TaxID=2991836 RepID=UPI0024BB6142|nr:transporter substrate-binding domain-containing protein [Faecalispora anaeroviscerum]